MQADATPMTALPLRDIKLPIEPGFWPLAPGWWLVLLVLLTLLALLTYQWLKWRKKHRRWLHIETQLAQIEFDYLQTKNKQQLLVAVSAYLRRFIKFQLHDNQAVSLTGLDWIEYLNNLQTKPYFVGFEDALTHGVFQTNCQFDAKELISSTRDFMKQHVMNPSNQTATGVSHV